MGEGRAADDDDGGNVKVKAEKTLMSCFRNGGLSRDQ